MIHYPIGTVVVLEGGNRPYCFRFNVVTATDGLHEKADYRLLLTKTSKKMVR